MNFATSKNLIVKSTKFPHRNIHEYTWTSPDGITQSQIDHVAVNKRRQSSIIRVRSLRGMIVIVIVIIRESLSLKQGIGQYLVQIGTIYIN